MPLTIETQAFGFDELDDRAKERAREWYRGCIDNDDFSCEIDEFATIAGLIGIDFDTHEVTLYGGGKRREPNIYWSVSCSQGDGACFEGTYDYRADAEAKLREINNDDSWEPIRIAAALAKIQAANAFGVRATVKQSGSHYCHEHTVSIDVVDRRNEDRTVIAEEALAELLRDLMRYLYSQLRDQLDYLYSDEAVDDSIRCNEYLFDKEGRRHAYA